MKLSSFLSAFALLLSSTAPFAFASDHLDAPALTNNGGDPQADVNDLYAFQGSTGNSVFIMTVNPFASNSASFGTDVSYQFQIDNNGDAIADLTYEANFGAGSGSNQAFTFSQLGGQHTAAGTTGSNLTTTDGGTVHAGVFDDPFFFDLVGFNDGFNFTGQDTFAGANVSAIVFELSSADLGGPNIGVWARTLRNGVQVDRAGRPAINTVLIGSDRKDDFNAGSPDSDFANFGAEVNAAIAGLPGSDQANADALTPILLPDLLTFDTSSSAGFLNGRGLADDVIDAELNLLTQGAATSDGVDFNDVPFQSVFPYLGVAAVPEPSGIIPASLILLGFVGRRRRKPAQAC